MNVDVCGDLPDRIDRLIDQGRIRRREASASEIVALWRKVTESAHDASLADVSLDGSLRAAYNAGHLACLALLAACNLRPTSGRGHHEIAFTAASLLGGPALSDLVPDSEEVRGLRAASMYDPTLANESDREIAIRWMQRTLPLLLTAIGKRVPEVVQEIKATLRSQDLPQER